MTKDIIDGTLLFMALVIPLLGVFFFCLTDRFVDIKRKRIYIASVLFVISLIFQNYIEYYLIEYIIQVNARTFVSVYGYELF